MKTKAVAAAFVLGCSFPAYGLDLRDNGYSVAVAASFEETSISGAGLLDPGEDDDSDLMFGVALSAEKRFENNIGLVGSFASAFSLNETFGDILCDEDDPNENCDASVYSYHFSLRTNYTLDLGDRFSVVPAIGVGYQLIQANDPDDTLESEFGGEASLKLTADMNRMQLALDYGLFKSSHIKSNYLRLGVDIPL